MSDLGRNQAPIGADIWQAIDAAAVSAARDLLTARRFIEVEGPFGVGLTAIEVGDEETWPQPQPGQADLVMGRALSVPMLRQSFRLSIRRVAAHRRNGQPLVLTEVQDAAEAVARREEAVLYYGQGGAVLRGLLTAEGRNHVDGGDWSALDRALADVLAAVNRLDTAGFRGPYALALAPGLYNGLFRHYAGTDLLQVEHLGRLCTLGIFKAAIDGGVVVDPRVGSLVIGQDLVAGYERQDGVHYHLFLTESLVLRLDEPGAICTISAG